MKALAKRVKGLTLLELTGSFALFVLSTVFLMRAFNLGYLSVSDLEKVNQAVYLANGKMEEIRSKTFGSIASEGAMSFPDFPGYRSTVDVSLPQPASEMIKKVVVTVFYPGVGGNGGEKSVQVKTLVVNN